MCRTLQFCVVGAKRERGESYRSGTEARDMSASGYDDEASINEDEEDARARMDRSEHAEKKQEHKAHGARSFAPRIRGFRGVRNAGSPVSSF